MTVELTRRRLLGLGAATGAGAALTVFGLPALARPAPATPAPPAGRSDPVSMAMHIHASFSEGAGSMHAQLEQARRLGIDVLWWTEHDFRLRAHGYRRAVRFEGVQEPEDGVDWRWEQTTAGPVAGASGVFVTDEHSPHEQGAALRLRVRGPAPEWGALTWSGVAWNSTYTTCIADTSLDLDVLAESLGPDAELVVAARLSFHPASGGRPAGAYGLEYRVGAGGAPHTEGGGLLGVVPRRAGEGWQRLHLDLAADVAVLWPDLLAGDNALTSLSVGVRARRGGTAQAVVDRLRFLRSGRGDALGQQAELIRQYAARYPQVVQRQGGELSLVRHLNVFGGEQVLPDYPQAGPRKDDSVDAAVQMVAWARRHRRLVSHNHPLDGTGAGTLARLLVETRNLGAHAIEVGSPNDVEAVAYAYDVAARNSVFATATGVSDDHSGSPWETRPARWVTSVWAGSLQEPDLLAALGAGRAWFWDLAGWSGTLDLQVDGGPAMGGVLVGAAASTPVEVVATDLPSDGSLEIVVGRVDNAGTADLRPSVTVTRLPAWQVAAGRTVAVPRDGYVRVVVRDRDGATVGFANPTWLLGQPPAAGVPEDRRLPV